LLNYSFAKIYCMKQFIQAENLSKRWGDLMLFENISFTVTEGQKVALIARNGTGKSTLLDILQAKKPRMRESNVSNDIKTGYFEQIPRLNP
jgi:ABC transport system ATP-binding/permease protein